MAWFDRPGPHSTSAPHARAAWGAAALVGLAAALTLAAPASAMPTQPDVEDRQIALAVRMYMERAHLTGRRIDDEVGERCLTTFLKAIDPWKLYFYQSDVDEFMRNKHSVDDAVRTGDIRFAYTVFKRFVARVAERSDTALALVDAPHDFTIDETMIRERDATVYPQTPEEAHERWRQRVKFDLLSLLADDETMDEAKEKLRKRYGAVKKRWEQTSDDELLELYLTSMTSAFDPHSSYMAPSTLENFEIQMRLELDGIGASLRSEDGYTEVHEIIPGGAADLDHRLKEGDQILGVGQGPDGNVEDIVDMKLNDVVKLIRGKRGTVVRLEVKPVDNPKERRVYDITRARIELKNQEARGEVVPWGKKPSGEPYRLGVIALPSFYMDMTGAREGVANYRSTTRDVRRLIEGFNREGVDAVVVDLRFNGGGSLQEAVAMTGLFIDQGPVVQVKGPDGRSQPYPDPEPGMVWSGPLAVLTNKLSASASEIFAGAIQDYGRGVVIGDESTHGKGTVQQLFNLGDQLFRQGERNLGALKMTIQQFYRPGGDSTQNRGVLADVTLPAITNHLEGIAESDLDYAMAFDQVKPLRHDVFGMMDANVKYQLQQASLSRVQASEDFKKDTKRIERYEEQRNEETITLNLEKYRAEREELDADKEEEEQFEKMSDSDRPVFDVKEHYNQETLNIVVDYLNLLGERRLAVAR